MLTPDLLLTARQHSANHKAGIMRGDLCGCFSCLAVFPPTEIEQWIPDIHDETALCPSCGKDTVIGEGCGIPIEPKALTTMRDFWGIPPTAGRAKARTA